MTRSAVVLSAVGFVLVLAPVAAAPQGALAEQGQKVFVSQKCSLCHSVAGKGNPKGALDTVGGKYQAAELREWIVNPREMSARTNATRKPPMKDYSALSKADVDALVVYLETLR